MFGAHEVTAPKGETLTVARVCTLARLVSVFWESVGRKKYEEKWKKQLR